VGDNRQWNGSYTALVTPFRDDFSVDENALSTLVEAQIKRGIEGLVVLGTTAETPTLHDDERRRVFEVVKAAAKGRVPLVVGTGSNATEHAIQRSVEAEKWGADAVLIVCPYYNRPTQEGLFAHYRAVSQKIGLPILAYNVPGRTGSDLLPQTVRRLFEAGAIIGLKDATNDMRRASETLMAVDADPRFFLLSGDDFTMLPFLALGGHGVMSVVSNVIPGAVTQLVHEARSQISEATRALARRIHALSVPMFQETSPGPVKAALALTGWCRDTVRLPLVPPNAECLLALERGLEAFCGTTPKEGWKGFMR
jgi:4-hydroxy-tetrahydrodipicolinate synthase